MHEVVPGFARTRARPTWLLLAAWLALPLMGAGCKKPEVCDDGADNDGDGQTDCDDAECSAAPNCVVEVCGNGAIDAGEDCDGANLNNEDCADQAGFNAGTLACNDDCTFNTDACENNGVCGDGVINTGEECDGNQLGGADCTDEGFASGTLACNVDCSFNTDACSNEACGNGIDDDANAAIDCNDAGCVADINCDTPSANNNAVGAGFNGALALAISNDGATAFFSAYNGAGDAAIFSVATAGGNATQLFAGAPLDKPTGLSLSPDGATLFITDLSSGANELGGVFSMPVAGAAPTAIIVGNVVRPSTVAVSNDGLTLFLGGANAANGQTGVFSASIAGGNATLLSALNDPAALSIAGNQILAVEAVSANHRSSVVKIPIAGGAPTVIATGFHMDYPAGVSTLVGDTTVLFSAVDNTLPNFGSGLFQVSINGGAITPVDVGDTFISAGALARARNNNNFVLVDTEAGAGVTGAIFRLQ
jgi:hypothetical protein